MDPIARLAQRARRADAHLVLPEGDDPRVRAAARRASAEGLARITLLTAQPLDGIATIDPAHAPEAARLAAGYHDLRGRKGVTPEVAARIMARPIPQAAMMVRLGLADGTVGGARATTADTARAAIQIIGQAPDAALVASCFLMIGADPATREGIIFADCGLVIAPSAAQLADITLAAAAACRDLLDQPPRVAMLSFSTDHSAEHPSLRPIREAVALVRARAPQLMIDGEMQFDAALRPDVRAVKAPGSPLVGPANVFVFPDLAAGNIGYKIAHRLGGMRSVGPLLLGLARPANDLSRGCDVDDIVAAIAVTAAQVGDRRATAP